MSDQNRPTNPPSRGWFVNVIGWFSFLGLFAIGLVGLVLGAAIGGPSRSASEPLLALAGIGYLLVGMLAFWLVLDLVLRRGPRS